MQPIELYNKYMRDSSLEYLDLSHMDFGWLCCAFIAAGGGSEDEFWDWLSSLSYDDARELEGKVSHIGSLEGP